VNEDDFMDVTKRGRWIPSEEYMGSYGHYVGAPGFISNLFFNFAVGGDKLWAVERAPPLERKLPLIVFSHGLAGLRTTYSTICCELASQGFIVAAVEHRDGSACISVSHQKESKTYIKPPPEGSTQSHPFRNTQLQYRFYEVFATLNLIESLDLGDQVVNLHPSAAKHQPEPIRFQIDRSQVIVMGHSFGACTAIYSVTQEPRFRALVCMDPWMMPLPKDFIDRYWLRPLPVHIINSSHFLRDSESNWSLVRKLLEKNQEGQQHTRMITVLNTAHQDISDMPALLPHFLLSRPPNPTDIEVIYNLHHHSILLFLKEIGLFEREEEVKLMTRDELTQNPLIRTDYVHDVIQSLLI
jgi:platelet-activating factor acetylhydrolase